MNKDDLLNDLDDLSAVEADFEGWVCWHSRYDPKEMGFDLVVEILELDLEVIDGARAGEILETETVTPEEAKQLKSYVMKEVENTGGEETSFWIGKHPDNDKVLVGMYQYEDGSRQVAGLFETVEAANAFPEQEGFDLV